MQECAICLTHVVDRDSEFAMPGCGHVFHKTCILTSAQYNVRCPTCRHLPDGVTVKRPPSEAPPSEAPPPRLPSRAAEFRITALLVPMRFPRRRRRRRS